MSEPNYNETVVIPLLQKKFRELTDQNLILEANLLVERERSVWLSKELQSLQSRLDTVSKRKKKDEPQIDGETF
jgi:hypothetical protein